MLLIKGIVTGVFIAMFLVLGIYGVRDYRSTETELKYDDGEVDSGWGFQYRGYAVKFSAENQLWILDKVSFCGLWEGKNKTFEIEIWDENLNEIAHTKKYNFSKYFTSFMGEYLRKGDYKWAVVDIPDVEVTGDFYVTIFENSDDEGIVYVGIDDTAEGKENSFFVLRDPNMMIERPWYPNYTGPVTWMIRATGYEGNVVLANSIDEEYSPIIENEIKRMYRNVHIKRNKADEFESYKKNTILIIFGGPDAYDGVGEVVNKILSTSEKEYLRTEGNYAMYVKRDVWKEDQVVIVLAGCDRERTLEAVKTYKDQVIAEIENILFE